MRLSALVLGSAASMWEEAEAALKLFTPDAVCAANNSGIVWPDRLDYWVTLHPGPDPNWPGVVVALEKRLAAGRNRPQVWGHKVATGIDRHTSDWKGSTGLLCVKVLREEGFERIVLAGVPMTREAGHFYDKKPWLQFDNYVKAWPAHKAELAPFVRSMTGYTKELFGEPTQEWFAG